MLLSSMPWVKIDKSQMSGWMGRLDEWMDGWQGLREVQKLQSNKSIFEEASRNPFWGFRGKIIEWESHMNGAGVNKQSRR